MNCEIVDSGHSEPRISIRMDERMNRQEMNCREKDSYLRPHKDILEVLCLCMHVSQRGCSMSKVLGIV